MALDHDQLGWKSLAFPISVDGLEIVASLYLVAQRRAGRPTGERTNTPAPSATGPAGRPAEGAMSIPGDAGQRAATGTADPAAIPLDIRAVARLIPSARAARASLASCGVRTSVRFRSSVDHAD